ncbi:hypothetical protein CIK05_09350 [Bdellovibrio sp. qaytius]|nr:hypothetical protein CIK05_09350 [Bdellovibrio sp. qaytius]
MLFSCTKKELPAVHSAENTESTTAVPVTTVSAPIASQTLNEELAFAKLLTSNLKFIASLEKEVLKLILENKAPEINQFEVLGYGFDKFNGAKTGFLSGFGCQKIAVRAGAKKFEIYSECTKPAKKLAEISEDLTNKNKLTVIFLTSNWKVILGNAAGINPDRVCQFTLKDNKVQSMDCQDTVFSPRITDLDINLYELKIKKYSFNRNQADELVVEGGQFKDMLEVKKINMTVPMTGKISIIEKELKVKDDFTDMQNKLLGLEEKKEEVKNGEKEENSKTQSGTSEVSGTVEEKAHTAEPEYIGEGESQGQSQNQTSGTVQTQEQNEEGQPEGLSIPPSGPNPSQPYGR